MSGWGAGSGVGRHACKWQGKAHHTTTGCVGGASCPPGRNCPTPAGRRRAQHAHRRTHQRPHPGGTFAPPPHPTPTQRPGGSQSTPGVMMCDSLLVSAVSFQLATGRNTSLSLYSGTAYSSSSRLVLACGQRAGGRAASGRLFRLATDHGGRGSGRDGELQQTRLDGHGDIWCAQGTCLHAWAAKQLHNCTTAGTGPLRCHAPPGLAGPQHQYITGTRGAGATSTWCNLDGRA